MDSKKVLEIQKFATALKESLTEILQQPVEDRSPLLTPGQPAGTRRKVLHRFYTAIIKKQSLMAGINSESIQPHIHVKESNSPGDKI